MKIHKDITLERWCGFSLFFQLANVGTDVSRAISWRKKGDFVNSNDAFERAMELLDATIADPKNRGPRRKELLRVRETLKDYFLGDNEYKDTDEAWEQYFYNFCYAAALERGR